MSQMRYLRAHEVAGTTATCPQCGTVIHPKRCPSGGMFYITTYCSRRCGVRARIVPIPEQACEFCGKMFRRPASSGARRYCSWQCGSDGKRNKRGFLTRLRGGYPVFWTGKAEVLVHRIVMEEKLGRPLRDTETVHHINGDRMDWRPENLELWDHAQPHGQRVPDKLAWCVEYLQLHGYVVTPPGSSR